MNLRHFLYSLFEMNLRHFLYKVLLLLIYLLSCNFPFCADTTAMARFNNCQGEEFYHVTLLRCVKCEEYCMLEHLKDKDYKENCQAHCSDYLEKLMNSMEDFQSNSTAVSISQTTSTPSSTSPSSTLPSSTPPSSTPPSTTATTQYDRDRMMYVFGSLAAVALIVALVFFFKKFCDRRRRRNGNPVDSDKVDEEIQLPLNAGDGGYDTGTGTEFSSSATVASTREGKLLLSRTPATGLPPTEPDCSNTPRAGGQSVVPDTSMSAAPASSRTQGDRVAAAGRSRAETGSVGSLDPTDYNLEAKLLPHDDVDENANVDELLADQYNIDVNEEGSFDSGVPHS